MIEQLHPNRLESLKPYPEHPIKRKDFIKTIEAGGISIEGKNITPIDYFSIPNDIGENQMKELIATILRVEPEKIESQLNQLNECLQDSKEFITGYLRQDLPKEIQNINSFNSTQDLFDFLSHTKTLRKKDKLVYAPFYCAVVSTMLAIWEYKKEGFQNLIHEAEYLHEKLFEEKENKPAHFRHLKKQKDPNWSLISIFTNKEDLIKASYSYRGKSKESGIAKLVRTPELTAEKAMTDGLGEKIEVENEDDVKKLIEFLTRYHSEKFKAKKLTISNIGNLFKKEDLKKIEKTLNEYDIAFLGFKNPSSNKRWQALKLEGDLEIPEKGEEGHMIKTRHFEIQITLVDNKNESGMARHEVYKGVQKLSAYTRLFGSFTEEYLDMICKESAEESNLGVNNIKKYIKKHFLFRVKTASHKYQKYASKEHIKRWQKTDLMPDNIQVLKT